MRIASNIQWYVYLDEAFEELDSRYIKDIAKMYGDKVLGMTTKELHDYIADIWHHCPAELDKFMGLPDSVVIPEEIDEDLIAEYLSDEYGFLLDGYDITTEYKLTEKGRQKAERYIEELKAKRKEILDAQLDTADETNIPDVETIENDIAFIGLDIYNEYYNNWGVTDNYDGDYALVLKLGEDFE